MIAARNVLRLSLLTAAGSTYAYFGYLTTTSAHPPLLSLIIGIVPLAVLAIVTAWQSALRWPALALCAVVCVAVFIKLDFLRSHLAWLYFIQHAGAMTILGIMFGSTLGSEPKDALCSRIACFVLRAKADANYLRYTWYVTLAWTVFFAACAVLSVVLFAFGPIKTWSLYANVLTPILLGAMFVGEYLIRLRALPDQKHFSIAATIRAYREYSRDRAAVDRP